MVTLIFNLSILALQVSFRSRISLGYQGLHTGSLLSEPGLTPTGLTAWDPPEKDVMPWTGDDAGGAELPCTGPAFSATGTPAFA